MKKILMAILSTFGLIAALVVGAGPAHAAPTLGTGDIIKIQGADGRCNVAALGSDVHGNKVLLTAGHCLNVGSIVTNNAGTRVGVGAVKVYEPQNLGASGGLDYAVAILDANVEIVDRPNPPFIQSIGSPWPTGVEILCKWGNGLLNVGERCGSVFAVTPTDACSTILTTPFDSGSPVYRNRTVLVGITSRIGTCATVFQRADVAVAQLTAAGGPGAGFTPIA